MNVIIIARKKTYEFQAEEIKFYKLNKSYGIGKRCVNCYVSFFGYKYSYETIQSYTFYYNYGKGKKFLRNLKMVLI